MEKYIIILFVLIGFACSNIETKQVANGSTTLHKQNTKVDTNNIFISVLKGDKEQLLKYLEKGGSANIVFEDNRTALMAAAWANQAEIIKLLIEHGADVNSVDNKGRTALIFACNGGENSTQTVQLLLKAGAHVNPVTLNGKVSALMLAAGSKNIGLVDVLIKAGADITLIDSAGNNARTYLDKGKRQHGTQTQFANIAALLEY